MWTGNFIFNDLVTSALGSIDNLQVFIDDVISKKYNGLQLDGFKFAPGMQTDFTYEQVEKEIGLNVMATYVDLDSPGTPISFDGARLSSGKIPRMKKRAEYDEDEMRKIMILQERFGSNNTRSVLASQTTLFNVVDKLIGSHTNSLTYQRHQMVSGGKLELTDVNNPAGIKHTFTASVPVENMVTLTAAKRWWTDAAHTTEGSDSNPIKDLKAQVRKLQLANVVSMHFEADKLTLEDVLEHSKVRTAIGYALQPLANSDGVASAIASNLSFEARKAAFEKLVGCPVKAIDSVVAVDAWNKDKMKIESTQLRAFKQDVFVLVPDGLLGEIKAVEPIKLPLTNGTYADYYGGRLLMTVDFNVLKKIQYFETELTALAVPNKPKYMYYLNIL